MKTNLYYKDTENNLRTMSYGESYLDLGAVNDQGKVVEDIISIGMSTPASVVLCAIEGGKK